MSLVLISDYTIIEFESENGVDVCLESVTIPYLASSSIYEYISLFPKQECAILTVDLVVNLLY